MPRANRLRERMKSVESVTAKLAIVIVFFFAWSTFYDLTNAHGSYPNRTIRFARPCDSFPWLLQPWTVIIYLLGGVTLPILPFCFNWRWPAFGFVLTCYTIAAAIAFVAYWAWPVSMDRPAFDGPDIGSRLMRWVQSADEPANCCPSSHAIFAVLGAALVQRSGAGRSVRLATWTLAIAVCATTITTGQHYFMDVFGGVIVAATAYSATRLLFSRTSEPT